MRLKALLRTSKLIVVMGRGGVGKTTVSATLGVQAAKIGLKTIVVTVDPANRLADALNIDVDMKIPTRLDCPSDFAPLYGLMLDRKQTCDELVSRFSKDESSKSRILQNTYYHYFSTALSGGQEYMAIEMVRQLLLSNDYDLIILDTPPSSHAFDFLDAPTRFIKGLGKLPKTELFEDTSFIGRLRQKGGQIVLEGLQKFTGSRFLSDLSEFLGLFRNVLIALEQSSTVLEEALRAPTTSFLYIDTYDHLYMKRRKRCLDELATRKLDLHGLIINRAQPSFHKDQWKALRKKIANQLTDKLSKAQYARLTDWINHLESKQVDARHILEAGQNNRTETRPTWFIPLKRNWRSDMAQLLALAGEIEHL